MTSIKAGDEVRIFDINGKRRGQPTGGWQGIVVKVGRALAHIEYRRAGETEAFRLDTGMSNDGYGHRWFKTLAQAEADERREAAVALLREARIQVSHGCDLPVPVIEAMAQVVVEHRNA